MIRTILPLFALLLLAACATLFSGTSQVIHIDSDPQGANCEMKRDGILLTKFVTPADIKIERTKHDIEVSCTKAAHDNAYGGNNSGVEGVTYADGGVAVFSGWGLVGWGIDSATGADNAYRERMLITLTPTSEVGGQYGFAPNR
ncbi:MAG: hypothetical protein AB7E85_04480 [Pseudobdellovibrionaceae bacterium]